MKKFALLLVLGMSVSLPAQARMALDCGALWARTSNKDYSHVTGESGYITGSATCYQISVMTGKCLPYRRTVKFTFYGDGTWSCSCGVSMAGDC